MLKSSCDTTCVVCKYNDLSKNSKTFKLRTMCRTLEAFRGFLKESSDAAATLAVIQIWFNNVQSLIMQGKLHCYRFNAGVTSQ
jgi:hypothetical protein